MPRTLSAHTVAAMIPPRQFVSHVIDPVLDQLAEVEPRMRSRAAQRLLLGTAIKESGLRDLVHPWFGVPMLPLPPDMWELLKIGVGGYIVGRSVEKGVKVWKDR